MGSFSTAIQTIEDILRYLISDYILATCDELKSVASSTYVKVKEIKLLTMVPKEGYWRTYFDLKTASSSYPAYGRIYRNNSPHGTERSTTSTTLIGYSENLFFVLGDTVEVWIYGTSAANNTLRVLGHIGFPYTTWKA